MPLPFKHDFKNPDYAFVFEYRMRKLEQLRKDPKLLRDLKVFYKHNPAQFIIDWGVTYDPRKVEKGQPSFLPFLLFELQEEWVHWFVARWKNQEPGLSDKSREMGLSWLTIATACTLCLFHEGMTIGFGSRKEEYVDKRGDPKSLLYKARYFLSNLPKEFRGSFDVNRHAPYKRIEFPDTNSIITGESGDGIGRGDRASIYVVDESAWLPRPELVEASLSETTNCRIDISTPWGMNNPFARKRHGGKISVFSLHWKDDPRKDQAWYDKKCRDIDDPVVIAQELDLDYSASVEGIVIPSAWVRAAIDAHIHLGITPTGRKRLGGDIADEGADKNAAAGNHGILIDYLEQWSGKGGDIYSTVEKIFGICDDYGYLEVIYDADGLGAGVRGDARVINAKRTRKIKFEPFRGSGAVIDPKGDPFKNSQELKGVDRGRTNEDYFANYKAQSWWALRRKFQLTYRAVVEKLIVNPDDIISLSSKLLNLNQLVLELSQPTYSQNNVGKILIDKIPDGGRSPNLADAVMIVSAPFKKSAPGAFSAPRL
jgi:hypothetical protein